MTALPDNVPPSAVVDFDLYAPPGLDGGFHAAWLRLHRSNPAKLLWTARNGGHWIVNDGALVEAFYADHERLSSRLTQVPRERSLGNDPIPASLDPPEQTPFRTIINGAFSPKVAKGMEEEIRAKAIGLIEALQPRGGCDFVTEFAMPLPLELFMSYADLPLEDLPRLRHLAEQKMRPTGDLLPGEIHAALGAYLDPYLRERRERPGEDLLSRIMAGQVRGRPIAQDEARRLCGQLLVAGLDTVAAMLSFIFLELAENPPLRAALAADPARHPAAIEEFLRRFPIVTRVRELDADITCDGVTMRAGDLLVLPTMLHGLDGTIFPDPETVDPDRPPKPTSTFGHGPHRCPGAFVARSELRIVLTEWLARIPDFTADRAGVDYRAGFVASIARLPLRW